MKHWISLLLALALLIGGLAAAERRHAQAPVSAQSLLYLVADSERDLTRLPAHFTRIADAQEISLGNTLAKQVLDGRKKLTADDQEIEADIARIGARIAPQAQRRLPFRFHYLPDRSLVNAFALPGGHVFVGAGLLEEMTTEDELASVLAHEVEHIDHYHCAERLQVEAALRKIPLGAVLQIPVAVFQAGYSKEQELEADREGVLLAARAGYSAAGALRLFAMFEKLEREAPPRTPQEEAARVTYDVLTGYFRSHPPMQERIAQVRAMIVRQPELAVRAERPLAVEPIIVGWKSLDAVTERKFALAAELATRALQLRPGYPAAMQALCEADYGLGRDAAAADVYRQLVARDTTAADAAEKWGEERAEELANAKEYGREIALVESLLTVQPAQPRLLQLAAWAYAMKGDDAAAAAKAMTITRLYMST
ncbi:MAG TPA: M48 family metalloprotease, partial [Thermoanaerobaculia bacterium]|nr:M48 family metalloprotease [Thermoanaerobaculia bacterium]